MGRFLVAAIAALLVCGGVRAGDTAEERASLKGIRALALVIEEPPADTGLSARDIEDILRTRIGIAGFLFIPESRVARTPGAAVLRVRVATAEPQDTVSVPRIRAILAVLEMRQPVTLVRDRNITATAATWSASALGAAESARLAVQCRRLLAGQADQFAQAVRTANNLSGR